MADTLTWLASYPKSGNTWVRLLLESLARGGADVDINRPASAVHYAGDRAAFEDLTLVDAAELTEAEADMLRPGAWDRLASRLPAPAIIKVHDLRRVRPDGAAVFGRARDRIVYVLRDPRDVACSLAAAWAIPIDEAIEFMSRADAMVSHQAASFPARVGDWSGHVESWTGSGPAALIVRYEDLHDDPAAVCRRLTSGLDWAVDNAAIEASIAATRFTELRRQEDAAGFAERPPTAERFFRHGRTRGWIDELTAGQASRIESAHAVVMRRFGYL